MFELTDSQRLAKFEKLSEQDQQIFTLYCQGEVLATIVEKLSLKIKVESLKKRLQTIRYKLGLTSTKKDNLDFFSYMTNPQKPAQEMPSNYAEYARLQPNVAAHVLTGYLTEVEKLRKEPIITRLLLELHSYNDGNLTVVSKDEKDNWIYPCHFMKNTTGSLDDIQSNLVVDWDFIPDFIKNFDYLHHRAASDMSLIEHSKVSFALKSIMKQGNILKLNLYPSDYKTGLETSEALGWELLKTVYEYRRDEVSRVL
jgi:hypothetical protein